MLQDCYAPSHHLISVLKTRVSLNWFSAPCNAFIRQVKLDAERGHDQDNQGIGEHCSQKSWVIARCVLGSEYRRSNDTANASTTNKCGRSERSLPLSANIIAVPKKLLVFSRELTVKGVDYLCHDTSAGQFEFALGSSVCYEHKARIHLPPIVTRNTPKYRGAASSR